MSVGVICTFTRLSAPYYREICNFFAQQSLSFSIHTAVCTLHQFTPNELALLPEEHASLLEQIFDYYTDNLTRMQISTFHAMVRGLASRVGSICTFGDCLGGYLTVSAGGSIFTCNRFAYHPEWQVGKVQAMPMLATLAQSTIWQTLRQRELTVHEDCGVCTHFEYCKGGCAYNAVTSGEDRRDPHCPAYYCLEVISKMPAHALILASAGIFEMTSNQHCVELAHVTLLVLSLFGTAFSVYLTFLEPFVIGSTCLWCLSSALLMGALLLIELPEGWQAVRCLVVLEPEGAA